MTEARTIPAKYIFMDIVGFTHGRSVEAQSDIIHTLNDLVRQIIDSHEFPENSLILLPTGDGMCIAILNIESPFDVHLLTALQIIRQLHEHNEKTHDEMRKFQIRIGLNANIDNLVTDINSNLNVAGAGISMASRFMDMADGNQILVGETVFETLRYREKYMSSFRRYSAKIKHNIEIFVYQYIGQGHNGLNVDPPKLLETPKKSTPKLSNFAAHYFCQAIKYRSFFLKHKEKDEASTMLLYFLAKDSLEDDKSSEVEIPYHSAFNSDEGASLEEQLNYYHSLDAPVISHFARFVLSAHLSEYRQYFEGGYFQYQFITTEGVEKVQRDWPDIYNKVVSEPHA